MGSDKLKGVEPRSENEQSLRALYQGIIERWNKRSARDFASLFADDANIIAFDGGQMKGRVEIETVLE